MLSISFGNKDIFSDLIKRLQKRISSQDEAAIGDAIKTNFDEVWASKGASLGSPWKNNVTLVDTGALRSQMTSGRNFKITKNQVTVYSTLPYASFVDAKYPFLDLSAGTLRKIARVFVTSRVRKSR